MIGQRLKDRYTIQEHIGSGSMGRVYLASDDETGEAVAIKVLPPALASDPHYLRRFEREAEALRDLNHPHIVPFVDSFQWGEDYYLAMAYMPGGSLMDRLHSMKKIPVDDARRIAIDICDALIRAHRLDIVHRDIKPENILFDADGIARLSDFGVAMSPTSKQGTRLTGTGTQMGTPYYMSPEAWQGERLDAQADIWSMGILFYEMLSGEVPFDGESAVAVMRLVLSEDIPDIRTTNLDVPAGLIEIVERALAKDKSERYQTIREMSTDLERGEPLKLTSPQWRGPGLRTWGVALILLIVLAVAGFFVLRDDGDSAAVAVVPTETPSETMQPSETASETSTSTPTETETQTPTDTPTDTPTPQPTDTPTLSATDLEQTVQANVQLAVTENAQTFEAAIVSTPTLDISGTTFVRITQTQNAIDTATAATAAAEVTEIPEVDLLISRISGSGVVYSNVLPRTENFYALVQNAGTEAVGPFDVVLYLDDSEFHRETFDGLGAGEETSTEFVDVTLTEYGDFRVRAVVDEAGDIPEFDESNNEAVRDSSLIPASWTPTPPADVDLTVSVAGDERLELNGSIETASYRITVENIGTEEADAFDVALFLDDEEVYRTTFNAMGPGQSIDIDDVPVEFSEAGEFELIAVVDANSVIPEVTESNNRDSLDVTVEALPEPAFGGGTGLAAISSNCTVHILDITVKELVNEFRLCSGERTYAEGFRVRWLSETELAVSNRIASSLQTVNVDGDVLREFEIVGITTTMIYSPDLTQLVRSEGGDLLIQDVDTRFSASLVSDGESYDPNWSPDGTQILFAGNQGGEGIFLFDLTDTERTRVTLGHDDCPVWSPDGTQIAFLREETRGVGFRDDGQVHVMDADGTNVRQVSSLSSGSDCPAWTPDGEWIAFVNEDGLYAVPADGGEHIELMSDLIGSSFIAGPPAFQPLP